MNHNVNFTSLPANDSKIAVFLLSFASLHRLWPTEVEMQTLFQTLTSVPRGWTIAITFA